MSQRYRVLPDSPCYHVTCSTIEWMPIFLSSTTCDVIVNSLAYCQANKGLLVFGYVIMPTHFHAVLATTTPGYNPGASVGSGASGKSSVSRRSGASARYHASERCSPLSAVLRDLKRATSRELSKVLNEMGWCLPLEVFREAARLGKGNTEYKVWQDGFHPVAIVSEAVFRQKIEYMHLNPVRKGLVAQADHWWYSSVRAYLTGDKEPLNIDLAKWD